MCSVNNSSTATGNGFAFTRTCSVPEPWTLCGGDSTTNIPGSGPRVSERISGSSKSPGPLTSRLKAACDHLCILVLGWVASCSSSRTALGPPTVSRATIALSKVRSPTSWLMIASTSSHSSSPDHWAIPRNKFRRTSRSLVQSSFLWSASTDCASSGLAGASGEPRDELSPL
jgi:hypothetical protein